MTTSHITCPVCLEQIMQKVRLGPEAKLELDFCAQCGGVWFDQGEVQGLRSLATVEDIQGEIPRRTSKMRCHDCSAVILRDERVCIQCGWENILSCPCCHDPMLVERHAGLLLDICRSCKGVWFDNSELEAIWLSDFDASVHKQKGGGELAFHAENFAANVAGEILSETVFSLGSEVVKSTSRESLDHAVDGSSSFFETVISAIAEGIFDGL